MVDSFSKITNIRFGNQPENRKRINERRSTTPSERQQTLHNTSCAKVPALLRLGAFFAFQRTL